MTNELFPHRFVIRDASGRTLQRRLGTIPRRHRAHIIEPVNPDDWRFVESPHGTMWLHAHGAQRIADAMPPELGATVTQLL